MNGRFLLGAVLYNMEFSCTPPKIWGGTAAFQPIPILESSHVPASLILETLNIAAVGISWDLLETSLFQLLGKISTVNIHKLSEEKASELSVNPGNKS